MAYKISMWIVLFLLFFNGGAAVLDASGASGYLGLDKDVGGNEELEQTGEDLNQFETGSGAGQTLFGLYNKLTDTLETAFSSIFPAAQMMQNAGVPSYITAYGFAGLVAVPGFDLVIFLRSG